jgi:AraC-like DNA-binding protein
MKFPARPNPHPIDHRPILARLQRALGKMSASGLHLPQSLFAKAIACTLDNWTELTAYSHNGRIEIDNNLVENAIRPTAIGKKNWLFICDADACISAPNKSGTDSRIEEIVRTAERHLAEKCGEVIDLPKLAAGWGIGYTTFRRAFALRTGVSPWQYVLQARMNRVRRALADTDATLDEIAATTGFGSGYHLANFFKKAHSMPPGTWRKSARKKSRISK